LGKIACGDFAGHDFVGRRQKARFLPAVHRRSSAAISADITPVAAGSSDRP
jgi:hypothetical protein